jgi:hypothetical protein
MMPDLTSEDWHAIHYATKAVQEPFTSPEGISAIAEANYRAGLAAGRVRALEEVKQALDWYGSRAADLARYVGMKPPQITAVEAVMAELMLDAGKRALNDPKAP